MTTFFTEMSKEMPSVNHFTDNQYTKVSSVNNHRYHFSYNLSRHCHMQFVKVNIVISG